MWCSLDVYETGIAISLVGSKDWSLLAHIERFTGQRLERSTIAGLEPRNREQSGGRSSGGGGRSSGGGARGGSRGGRPGGGGGYSQQNNRSFGKPKAKPGQSRARFANRERV